MSLPIGDQDQLVRHLANIAQSMGANAAHLQRAAARLALDRPEPTLASVVAQALQADRGLARHYTAAMRTLVEGVEAYVDENDQRQPGTPGAGDHLISALTRTQLQDLVAAVGRRAATRRILKARRSGRPLLTYDPDAYGRGAEKTFVEGVRRLLQREEVSWWCQSGLTRGVRARPGGEQQKTRVTDEQFRRWLQVASTTGDDPVLDRLLLLTLRHTAWRQEELLNLTLAGMDFDRPAMQSSSKFGKPNPVPVNLDLMRQIRDLAMQRGSSSGGDPAFVALSGRALTGRRFDTITRRLKDAEPWAEALAIGPHALRRRTLSDVAEAFGGAASKAWAGHTSNLETIDLYIDPYDKHGYPAIATALFGPLDQPLPPAPVIPGDADVFGVAHGITAPR